MLHTKEIRSSLHFSPVIIMAELRLKWMESIAHMMEIIYFIILVAVKTQRLFSVYFILLILLFI
jgi:hypothetical protein